MKKRRDAVETEFDNALIGCWFARRLASRRSEILVIPKKRSISLTAYTLDGS
jgi:hypothetical protein